MEQLEKAIIASSDPGQSNEVRQQAALFINNFLAQSDGWKRCLETIFTNTSTVVTVFCFETLRHLTLHNYDDLTAEDKALLRTALFKWLLEYTSTNTNIDPAVKGKFAQVLVAVFSEYPTNWPDFFPKLFSALSIQPFSPVRAELYLRILSSIDELVISLEFAHSNADLALSNTIKDYMRDDCVPKLATTWYYILTELSDQYPHLGVLALKNIRYYVGWIDIKLIVNDDYINLFFKLLGKEKLRDRVCQCLEQIVTKGMDFGPKIEMIKYLRVHELISSTQTDDEEFLIHIGQLLNAIGLQAIQCRSESYVSKSSPDVINNTDNMVQQSIQLTGRFLGNEDDGVSESVLPFVSTYVYKLRHVPKLPPNILNYLHSLLGVLAFKMKYDSSFNFEHEEDAEAEFLDFRKELEKLFRSIVSYAPQLAFEFLQKPMESMLTSDCTKCPMAELESYLRLFYVMGESVRHRDNTNAPFYSYIMNLIMKSNITHYPHEAVINGAFEVLVRYASAIPKDTESIKNLLAAFLGNNGIRHPNPHVRGRVCYLFVRIVRELLVDMRPFFPNLLESIFPLLTISLCEQDQPLSDTDQQYLYEVCGLISFELRDNKETHKTILERILSPLLMNIEKVLNDKLYVNDPPENPQFAIYLVRAMDSLAIYTKGFKHCTEEAKEPFTNALRLMIRALQLLPQNEDLRSKILFFLHRMIECMQKDIFPFIPAALDQMLDCIPSAQSFVAVIRLINQLIARFRQDVFEMIELLVGNLSNRLFSFYQKIEDPSEQKELQRFYFMFIQQILQSNIGDVFFTNRNIQSFVNFFNPIVQESRCAIISPNWKNVKICFTIFYQLVSKKLSNTEIISQMIPAIIDSSFSVLVHPEFSLEDVDCSMTIAFIAKFHTIIRESFSQIIIQRMQAVPGIDNNTINTYISLLSNKKDTKASSDFLKEFSKHFNTKK